MIVQYQYVYILYCRFNKYFEQFRELRMWKMQLVDSSHLLIKYASEDVVTLRVQDPNTQPAFFVLYNFHNAQVLYNFHNAQVLYNFHNAQVLYNFHNAQVLYSFHNVQVLYGLHNVHVLLATAIQTGKKYYDRLVTIFC